jgi:hypothetical protein
MACKKKGGIEIGVTQPVSDISIIENHVTIETDRGSNIPAFLI